MKLKTLKDDGKWKVESGKWKTQVQFNNRYTTRYTTQQWAMDWGLRAGWIQARAYL
jgi:hypothetical protein